MKTILKSTFTGICTAGLICSSLPACQAEKQHREEKGSKEIIKSEQHLSLRGKTLRLDYGGTIYTVRYADDQLQVHWQTTLDGTQVEDFEQAEYRQIEEGIYFVSWIEQSGETVSQVLNLKNMKVYAFVTTKGEEDEEATRGGRQAFPLQGSITILEE